MKTLIVFYFIAISNFAYSSIRDGSYIIYGSDTKRCPQMIVIRSEEVSGGVSVEKYYDHGSSIFFFRNETLNEERILTVNKLTKSSISQEIYKKRLLSKEQIYAQKLETNSDEKDHDFDLLFLETDFQLINSSTLRCEYIKE